MTTRRLFELGRGGMGVVYVAVTGERLHVTKELRPDLALDPASVESFRSEARLAAGLRHPNIVRTNEARFDGRRHTIDMEYLEGQTLEALTRKLAARQESRLGLVVFVLCEALAGLQHAHEAGVVHRDVSPHNVFVTSRGEVKLLDFGIAKAAGDEPTAVKGKLTYMAPEQAARARVDRRADLFSVGVILWQALAGRRMWQGLSEAQITRRLARGEVPAPEGADGALAEICRKALAHAPSDRFDTANEMRGALLPHARADAPELAAAMRDLFADELEAEREEIAARLRASDEATHTIARPSWAPRVLGGLVLVAALAGGLAVRPNAVAAGPTCSANAQCGREHVCRKDDGVCVPLASKRCRVLAEEGAASDDATVWVGLMFPTSGPDAEAWGTESVNAAELARRDFTTIARGIPAPARPSRPLGLVACDDSADAEDSARHLVDLRVPAVVGFRASQEVIDLARTVLIPNGVLALATQNQSPLLTTIPHPEGSPRLVFRTTISTAQSAPVAARVVSDILAPALGEKTRVALFRPRNTGGLSISDLYFASLRWNGKSALEHGEDYREFVWDEDEADLSNVAAEVVRFRPHVILMPGVQGTAETFLAPIERGLAHERVRPRYVVGNYIVGEDFFRFVGKNAELRRRFVGVTPPTETAANARLAMHYNDRFSPKVPKTATPGAVYDAMYLLAYAVYALGDAPIRGPALAGAIGRLVPPGAPIDVGPARIFDVFAALRGGANVDLGGAATTLDFDLSTGDVHGDFALQCVGVDETGAARETFESGVVFRAAEGRFVGLPLACP